MASTPTDPTRSETDLRRAPRFEPPPCPDCPTKETHVATRTEYVLYLRCRVCGHVWSVPKPGVQVIGT